MSMRDHILTWANEQAARGNPVSIQKIAEHVDGIVRRQAAAAKRGMNAAKAVGAHMEANAKRLAAESSPEALESMVINANWSVCSRGQMDAAHT